MNSTLPIARAPRLLEYTAATVVFFLMLFGPKTIVGNLDLLGTTCVLAMFVWSKYLPVVLQSWAFWLTLVSSAYIVAVLSIYRVSDHWWLMKAPRMIINYVGVFVMVFWALRRFGRARVLRMFHNAVLLHALVVIGIALIPPFGTAVAAFSGGVTKSTFQISGLTRGLALTSIVMMFPFVTYTLFAMLEDYRERYIYIKLVLILWATLYMGRTGFYLCLGTALAVILVLALRRLKNIKIVLIVGSFLAVASNLLVSHVRDPDVSLLGLIPGFSSLALPVAHMFEPLFRFIQDDALTASTIEQILEMPIVYHNDTLAEKVFGAGLYGRGDEDTHLSTDVAYLHMFSAFGFLGLTIFIATHFGALLQNLALWRTPVFWSALLISVFIIIANFKETALFTRHLFTVQILFVTWLTHEHLVRRAANAKLAADASFPSTAQSFKQ